jgi:hypothetical protein
MSTANTYTDGIAEIAADIVRQMIDQHAASRAHRNLTAGGAWFHELQIFYCDFPARPDAGIPAGIVRVAMDAAPRSRRPANEASVFLQMDDRSGDAARWAVDDLAAAVLEELGATTAHDYMARA